ncbi:SDR family oxidoreductase [Phenylobacterium sp.]|uniref:SDR family oxidoreductase n=1 Tax=Phenylobacterium sp. TaxID=1871053 RepID=UPI002F3F3BAB
MGRLDGKTIVVTGAGRGLGRQLIRRFVEEGGQVIAAARNAARLIQAVEPLGGRAIAVAADVGEPDDVARLFAEADKRFGKLDALINNAAIYDFFRIADAEPARIRTTVHANLLGPMLCTRAAIPLLRKAGGGDIINVSSESVRNPYAYLSAYAATKAGLENFSQGMRTELRPDNIRVTALRLGVMDDPDRDATGMDLETQIGFAKANQAALAASGTSKMSFDSVAHAIMDMLTMPADIAYDMVELRPCL